MQIDPDAFLEELSELALCSGANYAAVLSCNNIVLRQDLAEMCRKPLCPNFGLSASCPPHIKGREYLEKFLFNSVGSVFFRLDGPAEIVLSYQHMEIMALIHELSAIIERAAIKRGFEKSSGFAGGSCKKIFCASHDKCRVVCGDGNCRHPDLARPSMSGFGMDVNALAEKAGWPSLLKKAADREKSSIIPLYGLVIVA